MEREKESKDALLLQKRRITSEWAALNRLRKRFAMANKQHAADNARLSDEFQHVVRAFNHLQCQSGHRKAANRARFEQVQAVCKLFAGAAHGRGTCPAAVTNNGTQDSGPSLCGLQIRVMKEEELAELLEELLEADQIISSCVAGLPLPAGNDEGTLQPQLSSVPGSRSSLELIGTALHTSRTAVVDVYEAEEGQPPGPDPAAALSMQTTPQAHDLREAARKESGTVGLDAEAVAELLASIEYGALSQLMTDGPQGLGMQKLKALLRQAPSAAADGQLTAAAVARCLGLQLEVTVDALDAAFRGAAAGAKHIHGPAQGSAVPNPLKLETPESPISMQHVELGLQHLVQRLLASQCRGSHSASGPQTARQPAIAQPPVTSKQYWQARADVLLPRAVLRTWELLEQQANSQLVTLQGKTSSASKVGACGLGGHRIRRLLMTARVCPGAGAGPPG